MDVTRWRISIVAALGLLLAVGAGGAFDSLQWPLFVPVSVTAVIAALMTNQRLLRRIVAGALGVIVGVAAAVLADGGTLRAVGDSFVRGPRLLLTTEWPSPAAAPVIGAVAMMVAVVTGVAADLAGRRRLHLAPLGAFAVGWSLALAIGAPVRPATWVIVSVGVLSVLLAIARFDTGALRMSQLVLSDRTLVVSLTAIAVVSVGTASAVAWADRADPRRPEAAESNAAVLDSVEAMVALRRAEPEFPLFAIDDRSRLVGQSFPARWRIAALDTYDGQRWVPRLTLRPIGGRLGLPATVMLDRPPPIAYELEFLSDDIDLLPFPGPPLSTSIDVETDLDRIAVRAIERPDAGMTVVVESEVSLTSRSALGFDVAPRQIDELAAGFTEGATRLVGDGTVLDQIRRLEETMRSEWRLDSATPGGGQQLALIERFVTDTQRGTTEQFVTAFVMMVRSLGFDARIATGFVVPPEAMVSPLRLESSMAAVWPEVRMVDEGWVAFDPVPTSEAGDEEEPPPPPEAQTPAAAQPPVEAPTEEVDEVDEVVDDVEAGADRWATLRTWAVRATVGIGLGLLPFAAAVGIIIGVKERRRRRRIRVADAAVRIRGAWANATDSLVDAGLAIGASWTDDRIAVGAAPLAPTAPHEMRRLASMSTRMTFGTASSSAALADDALLTADAVDRAILADRTRWQRLKWRLSLRSLRSRTRSPVTVEPAG